MRWKRQSRRSPRIVARPRRTWIKEALELQARQAEAQVAEMVALRQQACEAVLPLLEIGPAPRMLTT
jgi:hypothetical protein